METDIYRIQALLQREYLFHGLDEAQLAYIAGRFRSITLDRETIVFNEGAPPDCFYIISDGSVRLTRWVRGKDQDRLLAILREGDFFGEQALLTGQSRSETATTVERTRLLRLDGEEFFDLLEQFPQLHRNMSATSESRGLAGRTNFDWLDSGEMVYLISQKHVFFLFLSLLIPILLTVGAFPVLAIAVTQLGYAPTFYMTAGVGALMLIIGLAWGVWNYLDWSNDYYVVTSKRVVWLEKVILLYDSRRESPLDQVQAVTVISSFFGQMLGYGTVRVSTFTGSILMRNMRTPHLFSEYVEGYKKRVISLSKQREADEIDQAIKQGIQRAEAAGTYAPTPAPMSFAAMPRHQVVKRPLIERLRNSFKVRYEEAGVVTYRKHWLVLFAKTWLPDLMLLATLGMIIFLIVSSGSFLLLVVLATLAGPILSLWWLYQYWDWRNDIYQLTPTQVFDIDRKPLGTESKKSANLADIQGIEHSRDNIINIIFDYGTVTINAGTTKLTFDYVVHPDDVHNDVADYRDALNRKKREDAARIERERLVQSVVSYHLQQKMAREDENSEQADEFSGYNN